MSRPDSATVDFDPSDLPPPVCRFCGGTIDEVDQDCPARPEGVCSP